jgi:single-strand DNA-binding protein
MPNYNVITVIGHLGRDPEVRYAPSGDAIANFSVAVTEKYKDKGGNAVEHTNWFRAAVFGKLGETCAKYLHKGDPVMLVGSMQNRKYTDKDGVEKDSWEIRVDKMVMLGGKPSQGSTQSRPPSGKSSGTGEPDDGEIPF